MGDISGLKEEKGQNLGESVPVRLGFREQGMFTTQTVVLQAQDLGAV